MATGAFFPPRTFSMPQWYMFNPWAATSWPGCLCSPHPSVRWMVHDPVLKPHLTTPFLRPSAESCVFQRAVSEEEGSVRAVSGGAFWGSVFGEGGGCSRVGQREKSRSSTGQPMGSSGADMACRLYSTLSQNNQVFRARVLRSLAGSCP